MGKRNDEKHLSRAIDKIGRPLEQHFARMDLFVELEARRDRILSFYRTDPDD